MKQKGFCATKEAVREERGKCEKIFTSCAAGRGVCGICVYTGKMCLYLKRL